VALTAPRTARLVGVDDETLRSWSERGLTQMPPEEAALARASESEVEHVRDRLKPAVRSDDEGYVLSGRMIFADEHDPHLR
jgi:predicted site-specific integrase-resolvase